MELKGSCHCGSVKFTVPSPQPYPFILKRRHFPRSQICPEGFPDEQKPASFRLDHSDEGM